MVWDSAAFLALLGKIPGRARSLVERSSRIWSDLRNCFSPLSLPHFLASPPPPPGGGFCQVEAFA